MSKKRKSLFTPVTGKPHIPMNKTKEIIFLNLGLLFIAVGVYFFKFPNNFAIGGVSGISVIVGALLPNISPSTLVFILNMSLLVLGFLVLGKDFGLKTAYTSIMLSFMIKFFEYIYPLNTPFTSEPMLELIFAIILPGIGAALLFNISASSGGTDIIAMILKKYSHINIGRALFVTDFFITIFVFYIFDTQTALLSMLGLFSKSLLVNLTLESINQVKYFTIITEKPEPIIDFIITDLHRGGTKMEGQGIYSNNERTVITVVVNNYEAGLLRSYVKSVDPKSFITIINTSQIIGRGFHYTQ